ncbi:MAG: hypothetical protein U5J82_08400 [Desulfobacterales bacterium]|nr:hypothetical protein [Desulfobacterales bacterium]
MERQSRMRRRQPKQRSADEKSNKARAKEKSEKEKEQILPETGCHQTKEGKGNRKRIKIVVGK